MSNWLFVSDVDDTLMGDDDALPDLMAALRPAREAGLTVAYNSSRPCADLRRTLAETPDLHTPDYLIGALGTEIQYGRSGEPLHEYTQHLHKNWHRQLIVAAIDDLDLQPHPAKFQTPLKASYDVPDPVQATVAEVRRRLGEAGLAAKIIFSGGNKLDIIPEQAGKGEVITFLADWVEVDPQHVAVSGDSGNDIDMFQTPRKGIVVGNADDDLRVIQNEHTYHATATHAGGVLEGLRHWGVLD